ncbi:MAG: hypothetical protein AABY15_02565 [Nanoarchaeota archaeon]
MLHGRDIYKMIEGAYEKGLGAQNIDEVISGKKLFLIDDSKVGSDNDKTFKLFTKDFAIEASVTVEMSSLEKETGTWEKDYSAVDVSKQYSEYPEFKYKKISDKQIMDWINKNITEFI